MGDIVHEVEELGRRRRRRGHPARPERELLRARPRRRAVPPAVRRPAARRRRGRRHPPGPLHVAAPEGPAARDDRGDGRVRVGVRAPAPAAAVRQRPHAGRACTAATPPSATSTGSPRPGRPSPTWRSPPTSSSGFPGETDDDFERTLEVVDEARLRRRLHVRLLAPARHRGGRAWSTTSCPPRSCRERLQRLTEVVERHALAAPRRRGSAGSRRSWSKARRRRTRRAVGPDPPEQARPLRPEPAALPAGDLRRRARQRARPPTGCAGERRGARRPRPAVASASRSPRDGGSDASPPRARRARPRREVGARARGGRARSATSRSSRSTRCRSTGAWTSAPPSRRRRAGRGAAPPRRRRRPGEDWSVAAFQAAAGAAIADIEARGRRRCWSAAPGLYVQAVVDGLTLPGRGPRAARPSSTSRTEARRPGAGSTPSWRELDPVAAGRIEPGNRAPHRARRSR